MYAYDNTFLTPIVAVEGFIKKYHGHDAVTGGFTALQLDLLVSFPLIAAAIGAFISVPLLRRFGRKKSLMVAYILFCIPGSFLQLFAPTLAAFSVGRFWNSKTTLPSI
jgi:MFS family permease